MHIPPRLLAHPLLIVQDKGDSWQLSEVFFSPGANFVFGSMTDPLQPPRPLNSGENDRLVFHLRALQRSRHNL